MHRGIDPLKLLLPLVSLDSLQRLHLLVWAAYVRSVRDRYLTSGQLADELGVSHAAVTKWARDGLIKPVLVTPGGHYRWDADDVRRQLREQRQRDE
jgi:hypothetical protein